MSRFSPGLSADLVHEVVRSDTAAEWGNELEVLATPVLLWLAEVACMRALDGQVEPDEMTLGAEHDVKHLAPTPLGFRVNVSARLIETDGRRFTFSVCATDGVETVLQGTHVRYLVDRSRFVAKLQTKGTRALETGRGKGDA